MTFLIIWYLVGLIAVLLGERYFEGEIRLNTFLMALVLGLFGFFIVIFVIVGMYRKIMKNETNKQKWKEFWNQKLF